MQNPSAGGGPIVSPELSVARLAARAGGDVVMGYFRSGVTMRGKQSYNLVSDADLEAERAIVQVIRQTFPEHAVLGEELHQAEVTAENLWVIDPLDGTNNFAHQIPYFAVSIAYYHRGQPVCGIVYDPLHDDWYEAASSQGAWHNGQRASVGEQSGLDEVIVGVGFFYDRGAMMKATLAAIHDLFVQQIHGIRRFGAASLDLCSVGVGRFGAFFEYELAPWDFAAGRLFVDEAGGCATTCRGGPLPLSKTSVLASNGRLHPATLEIVRQHLPPDVGSSISGG
jgi:myo-inositol-1(or 4)-monophosphatase